MAIMVIIAGLAKNARVARATNLARTAKMIEKDKMAQGPE